MMTFQDTMKLTQGIGTNLYEANKERKDTNTIESILSEAMASGDQNVLNDSVGKILAQVSPERQPQAIQHLQNMGSQIQEKLKRESESKEVLKLNEELNQQKSRTKSVIEDIVRPYGMMDPMTRMISWSSGVAQEKRDEINKRISAERKKSLKTQRNIYKRYGQTVPGDLAENTESVGFNQDAVAKATQIMIGLE